MKIFLLGIRVTGVMDRLCHNNAVTRDLWVCVLDKNEDYTTWNRQIRLKRAYCMDSWNKLDTLIPSDVKCRQRTRERCKYFINTPRFGIRSRARTEVTTAEVHQASRDRAEASPEPELPFRQNAASEAALLCRRHFPRDATFRWISATMEWKNNVASGLPPANLPSVTQNSVGSMYVFSKSALLSSSIFIYLFFLKR